jgi:hypothetical protein
MPLIILDSGLANNAAHTNTSRVKFPQGAMRPRERRDSGQNDLWAPRKIALPRGTQISFKNLSVSSVSTNGTDSAG